MNGTRARPGRIVLAALSLASCRPAQGPAALEARTLHDDSAAPPMRATYFPPATPRAGRHDVPVLVVEPILFRRQVLYEGGGLVTYLASEGFPVWLVWVPGTDAPAPSDLARGIAHAAESIARETGKHRFDVVGLSLGAEATLRALEPLTAAGSPIEVRRVAFVGGGFDFAYPRSFAARVAGARGGSAAALCTLDGDAGCARQFCHAAAALPWLGVIPRADEDELRPASERYPFVAGLTRLPVLFVNGKADGIAPSESMFPLYSLWGSREADPRAVPKLLFLAGRENELGADYDHFDLFRGERAPGEVWEHVASWLARE